MASCLLPEASASRVLRNGSLSCCLRGSQLEQLWLGTRSFKWGVRLPGGEPVLPRSCGWNGQGSAAAMTHSQLRRARVSEAQRVLSATTPSRGQLCLNEESRRLGPAISRSLHRRKSAWKAGTTRRAAGMAEPAGDAASVDYIPNFVDKGLLLRIRALCFYMWTYAVALPLFVVMICLQPFVLLLDKNRRMAQHWVNRIWASLTIALFYEAEITGSENLPSADEPAVYVANHQSFLDIYTLFLLGRPFKFISKTSNFLIPIVGWAMYLTGHVPLRRLDKRSQMECLQKCIKLVKTGVPVLFFPEGTRSSDGKMAAFKKGAFTIATRGNVPVVPISLIGTGKLMPNGLESTLRPGKVKIVIHPKIQGDDAEDLCKQARDTIARTLIQHGMPVL